MSADLIIHEAGVARQLRSGGWALDLGDPFPRVVADREAARLELDLRDIANRLRGRTT